MRKLILVCLSFLPAASFALSCPNNDSALNFGDSVQEALTRCGAPSTQNNYSQSISVKQKWIYYINNPNQSNTKVTLLLINNKVVNINLSNNNAIGQTCTLTSQNGVPVTNCMTSNTDVTSSTVCGGVINTDSTAGDVLAECGDPALQKNLQSQKVQVTELIYNASSPNTLVFEDGKLVNWK